MRVSQTDSSPIQNNNEPSNTKHTKHTKKTSETGETKHTHKAAAAEESSGASEAATVDVSSKSKEFAHAKQVASETPDVREEKIAELKRRIAGGNYHVDADAVADRMVDEHLHTSGMS